MNWTSGTGDLRNALVGEMEAEEIALLPPPAAGEAQVIGIVRFSESEEYARAHRYSRGDQQGRSGVPRGGQLVCSTED